MTDGERIVQAAKVGKGGLPAVWKVIKPAGRVVVRCSHASVTGDHRGEIWRHTIRPHLVNELTGKGRPDGKKNADAVSFLAWFLEGAADAEKKSIRTLLKRQEVLYLRGHGEHAVAIFRPL